MLLTIMNIPNPVFLYNVVHNGMKLAVDLDIPVAYLYTCGLGCFLPITSTKTDKAALVCTEWSTPADTSSLCGLVSCLSFLYNTLCCMEPLQAVTELASFPGPIPSFSMLHATYVEKQDEAMTKLDDT